MAAAPLSKAAQAAKGGSRGGSGSRSSAKPAGRTRGPVQTVVDGTVVATSERKDLTDTPAEHASLGVLIPLGQIVPGRNPRQTQPSKGDDAALAASVKALGVLQPIRVRQTGPDAYEIIFGHRRFAAAQAAKLKAIPAIVAPAGHDALRSFTEGVVENVLREQLDPLDTATAIRTLMDESGDSQEAVGKRLGRSQPWVADRLRLLDDLSPHAQAALKAGKVGQADFTVAHAKAIVSLPLARQEVMLQATRERSLSSKELEAEVRKIKSQLADEERAKREGTEAAERAHAALEAAKVGPKTKVIATMSLYGGAAKILAATLKELGWNVIEHDYNQHLTWGVEQLRAQGDCSCTAVSVENQWVNGENRAIVKAACIDRAKHQDSAKRREQEAIKAAEAAGRKSLEAARKALEEGFSVGENLTTEGLRSTLYLLASGQIDHGKAIVLRHSGKGVPTPTSDNRGPLWDTVSTMAIADVLQELAHVAAKALIPALYAPSAYGVEEHAGYRAWVAEHWGLDDSIVRGGRKPPTRQAVTMPESVVPAGTVAAEIIAATTGEPDVPAHAQEDPTMVDERTGEVPEPDVTEPTTTAPAAEEPVQPEQPDTADDGDDEPDDEA